MSRAASGMSRTEQKGWGHLNGGAQPSPSALPPGLILTIAGKPCSSSLEVCIGHLPHQGFLLTFLMETARRKREIR